MWDKCIVWIREVTPGRSGKKKVLFNAQQKSVIAQIMEGPPMVIKFYKCCHACRVYSKCTDHKYQLGKEVRIIEGPLYCTNTIGRLPGGYMHMYESGGWHRSPGAIIHINTTSGSEHIQPEVTKVVVHGDEPHHAGVGCFFFWRKL